MRETMTVHEALRVRRDSSDRATNRLPSTAGLEGTTIELGLEDGETARVWFREGAMAWQPGSSDGGEILFEGPYDAVEVRDGTFHVDADFSERSRSMTLVIVKGAGCALVVDSVVGLGRSPVTLHQRIRSARLAGGGSPYRPITETRELIGRRLICEYAPGTAMEHVYLNSSTLVWQRLKSPPELAFEVESEHATVWKVSQELFLLGSVGRFPLELVLLLDLAQNRNVGHLFGQSSSGSMLYQLCGAHITPLGWTKYPGGYAPP